MYRCLLLPYNSHTEKINLIENDSISLVENVKFFLEEIDKRKNLNCFLDVYSENALSNAKIIESKIKSKSAGKLAGMVVAVKDIFSIKGKRMTCGSKILKSFEPLYTATAIQKLIDEDAIIIGKTNLDEFAMGSSNENSAFGSVKNPINESFVPGGSSGGSAVAVAANLCDASIGTDTGGSVRQPAAFCGLYGLKPTYGRISRFGLTAFASSFDTVGIFAKNIDDTKLLLDSMSGKDENDSTSVDFSETEKKSAMKSTLKIGVLAEIVNHAISPEIKQKYIETIDNLKKFGHEIVYIDLPNSKYSIATYYILTTAEASSNLARFDGARYGERSTASASLQEMYINSRTEGFGKEVKRRIMLGTYVLSSGYYDAYYHKAQKVRRIIKNDFDNCFRVVDSILIPTTPTPPFRLGEKVDDPLSMYLSDVYTTTANLAGIPGLNIPVGNNSEGLPIGVQLLADQFNEKVLMKIARDLNSISRIFG